jgi:hypothetical protein
MPVDSQMKLDKSLFWDVNPSSVDSEKHARFIIGRVLHKGNLNDWYEIKRYYGKQKIKEEITQVKYLNKITLSFCSSYFNIPKNEFKCYNTPQSIRELWDY